MLRSDDRDGGSPPVGADLPAGARFIGREPGVGPGWLSPDPPSDEDLSACVACGLCLPHCPTYRITGEESASPRGRIAAMRAVADGVAVVDERFATFMDECLVCRACEDVCPAHVPFGRMMEHARGQLAPQRGPLGRLIRWLGYDVVLARPWLVRAAALLQPAARPFLPARLRRTVPRRSAPLRRLPRVTEPVGPARGTVALLSGCVQDRWFHEVNRATIRVLARDGWRVVVPRGQRCCGALAAHDGRLETARRLARANLAAFGDATHVVANAAGCGAHLVSYQDLVARGLPVRDLLSFLHEEGRPERPRRLGRPVRVAYHDACHALRALGVHAAPRALLGQVEGIDLVEIAHGDRCCGAAGAYHVTQPELSARLRDEKVAAILDTGADIVASANPGCTLQLRAGLGPAGFTGEVLHPIQLLDLADAAPERP